MRKQIAGRTNSEVSQLSFGTAGLGIPYGIGVTGQQDMLDDGAAVALLRRALKHGVNFFDTARSYGGAEALLGKAFEQCRSQVVIATKCAHFHDSEGKLYAGDTLKEIMRKSLRQSLEKLRTDYIDIYMSHSGSVEVLNNPVITDLFQEFKQQGFVRAIGISTYTPQESRLAIEKGVWDVIQLPFNLMDQRQSEVFELAMNHGVAIVARSALLKGILTHKGHHLPEEMKRIEAHRKLYDKFLDAETPDLFTLAVKFVASHQQIASVLLGIDRQDYLDSSLKAIQGKPLSQSKLDALKQFSFPEPTMLDPRVWDRKGWLR